MKLSDRERFILEAAYNQLENESFDKKKGWKRIEHRISADYQGKNKRWRLWCVAILCIFFVGGTYFLFPKVSFKQEKVPMEAEIVKAVGVPVLTLEGGKQIALNHLHREVVKLAGTTVLADSNLNCIRYVAEEEAPDTVPFQYHTLQIPKGGEYSLVLSDGTRVWLNSESTLRFPVKFAAGRRDIELTGEIYLEVAHDALRPFYVHVGDRTIEVLGTCFNVSYYSTDPFWSATLVEGKIKITGGKSEHVLMPAERFVENRKSGNFNISVVDVEAHTSWVNGKISFREERLDDIIKKLQRWYDFEIFYVDPEIKDWHFGGAINKYNSFRVVLEYLERTADIHFDIQGKTVVARKRNDC